MTDRPDLDPNDETRPHDIASFSPAPEPRPDWSAGSWADPPPARPTPEHWFESAPTARVQSAPPAKRSNGAGVVLSASILSAVLASGGTFLALNASGALDRPAAPAASNNAVAANAGHQPITIDESSAIIDVAAKAGPAVVRITSESGAGASFDPNNPDTGAIPSEGVGSGVIFDSNGWILTNRHVVAGSNQLTVELKDGTSYTGSLYGIDTLTDLAIVKIDATGLTAATIGDSDGLKADSYTQLRAH
jgi:serine protease Do